MMKVSIFFLVLVLAACGTPVENNAPVQSVKVQPVNDQKLDNMSEKAIDFINGYVENCNKMDEGLDVWEWTQSSDLVTSHFKEELRKIIDLATLQDPELGLDADPIFNAQDYPESGFTFDSKDYSKKTVTVKARDASQWKLTITLVERNNTWLVDGCGLIKAEKRMN